MSDGASQVGIMRGGMVDGRLDAGQLRVLAATVDSPWLLVLDDSDRAPDNAVRELESWIQRKGDSFDAMALPCLQYIGAEALRFPPVYPGYQVRVIRKDRLETLARGELQVYPIPVEQAPHIHRKPFADLAAWVDDQRQGYHRRQHLPGVVAESFEEHLARAYSLYAIEPEPEGAAGLQRAACTALAALEILAGLEAWDARGKPSDLSTTFALPVRTVAAEGLHAAAWQEMRHEIERLNAVVARNDASEQKLRQVQAELDATRSTLVWRAYQGLERACPGLIRLLQRLAGRG